MIPAAAIARLHTLLASSAFISALVVGISLHYHKIVKNAVAQYPDEWFPSVSATIGDWFPERNLFQILIALTSGPRFALVFLQYYLRHSSTSSLPTLVFISGVIRTLSCGGWVYITSTDNHDIHDFMMILYIVCNVPWMLGGIATTPVAQASARKKRMLFSGAFFTTIAPLVYFYIQHKVHRVPGAYTRYAFFEWGLIFFDVLYDSVAEQEFKDSHLQIALLDRNSKKALKDIETTSPEYVTSAVRIEHQDNEVRRRNPSKPSIPTTQANALIEDSSATLSKYTDTSSLDLENSHGLRNIVSFLTDIYLSYIFWSLFTALIPTLFYFSVWELAIAGPEFSLLAVLSPIILALPSPSQYFFRSQNSNEVPSLPVLEFCRTRVGQATLQLASLVGIFAYAVPSPAGRLGLVFLANVVAVMRQAVTWTGIVQGEGDISYQAVVTGLAVLASSLAKQANRGNNPIWPFINHKAEGYNKLGIFLALIATYEYITRPLSGANPPLTRDIPGTSARKHSLLGAIPLGSLLFCVHNLLAESSTLIAWSWTGYENRLPRGPVPHLHGSLTILAMALGLAIAHSARGQQQIRGFISHPLWFLFGTVSSYVMYEYRDWTGYVGALGVAIFLSSIIPLVFNQAAASAVGTTKAGKPEFAIAKTYTIAMAIYCVFNVLSIFTVAYAFVPGGVYLRERSDIVTVLQLMCLVPAFEWRRSTPNVASASRSGRGKKSYTYSLLALISICSFLTTLYRLPRAPPQPFKPGTRMFNGGIWTVHFGIDNEGHDSQRGMLNLIRDMELDVVGLLETDLHRTSFGHRDLTRLIVEELNYNVDIGPGPNSHTWGAVLLSKFPIISTKHHLLPSPHGELAPAIEAVLDIYGTEVLVLVSHNGQEEDPLDRELQSTELAKIMAASTRPVVFLGYLVTRPLAPRPNPYGIMVNEGHVHDIDAEDNARWCEYILYRGLYRTAYARVSEGIITDTETQIGQFVLPRHGHNVTDDSREARYLRSWKEELPVEHWFPMEYYGNKTSGGVNGHYYTVFNTPLYYKIPEDAVL
ncbi:hypothetical protein CPC08DRAFT_704709 [Agrocybe pediades]|nr:hypothetical protein CPC08DRAFT_704709 [Agrocybe pediades]